MWASDKCPAQAGMPVLCVPVQGMIVSKPKSRILLKSWLLFHSLISLFYLPLPNSTGGWTMGSCDPLIPPFCFFFLFKLLLYSDVGPPWTAVLKDKPTPLWAFSSKGIFPYTSMGQQRGYLLHVVSTNIAGESLHHRCLLSGPALLEFYTGPMEGVLVLVQDLAWLSCEISAVEGTGLFQSHLEPGCFIKTMAHFRQE